MYAETKMYKYTNTFNDLKNNRNISEYGNTIPHTHKKQEGMGEVGNHITYRKYNKILVRGNKERMKEKERKK